MLLLMSGHVVIGGLCNSLTTKMWVLMAGSVAAGFRTLTSRELPTDTIHYYLRLMALTVPVTSNEQQMRTKSPYHLLYSSLLVRQ